tara:strand:- start:10713 stop:11528 length:816 start_codon:yes stop_codon:yes gene_type:complete
MANKIFTGATSGDFSVAGNWLSGSAPVAADNLFFIADYNVDLTAGLDQTAVTYGKLIVEAGYTGKIGTKIAYLQIPCTDVDFKGSGESYIDVSTSAIDIRVDGTGPAPTGKSGLYLKGSAIDEINVISGSVGVASKAGETATVTTIVLNGGAVVVGDGCTLTNATVYSGQLNSQASVTTLKIYNGSSVLVEAAAVTTLSLFNGSHTHNGTGTIATANIEGGTLDLFRSGLARTITTLNLNPGGNVIYDPDLITITTLNITGGPTQISSNNA